MHQNRYWLIFLVFLACCLLGYSGYTAVKLYQYSRLSQQIPADQIQWNILALDEDDVALKAHYQFSLQGISYEGEAVWDEHYLNSFAAKEALNELNKEKWKVWINPSWPHDSALQKKLPFKQCLSTLVLWGLFIYFIWLGHYVTQFSPTGYPRKKN